MSDAPEPDQAPEEGHPRGAFFLAIVFLVMVALLWLWTYAVLLDRV